MSSTLGYDAATLTEYKTRFTDAELLDIVQSDLNDWPDDTPHGTALEEVEGNHNEKA